MSGVLVGVVEQMQRTIRDWEASGDRRAIFLECYSRMTANMLRALEAGEFQDTVWVNALLHRFAEVYFEALYAFDSQHPHAPAVWDHAFRAAHRPDLHVLQHLILGVNAHINYDLVFVIVEMLRDEWPGVTPDRIASRYHDHRHVNEVIYRTIDAVQDEVIERYSPSTEMMDLALFRLDEWLLYRLISGWREQVWHSATALLNTPDAPNLRQAVEARALLRGQAAALERGLFGLRLLR